MLSRRDVLRWAGLGAAALGSGCGDNLVGRADRQHTSMIIEPTATSFRVVLWSRLARRAEVTVRLADRLVVESTIELATTPGGSTRIDGCEPATDYDVTLTTDDGFVLGPHHVRTAPLDTDPRAVRIAVGADVDPNARFATDLLMHLAAADADVYVSLGDFPYADDGPPAYTTDEFRARYTRLYATRDVREWLVTCGVRAMYDDHEFINNWDVTSSTAEPARYAAALHVWDEFFPLEASGSVRYRRWHQGANVECFLLDTRRFRGANAAPDGPGKTMLGDVQRAWLVESVRSSTAPFKLIFSTVPLGFVLSDDDWSHFATERDAIFLALVGVPGVLFVTGDQHYFAARRHAHGHREFQVGPLRRGLGTPPPVQSAAVLFQSIRYNAGLIDITPERLTIAGLGEDGSRFYEERFSPADLTAT